MELHQLPPRLSDTPLGEGGRGGIEAGAGSEPRDVKQDQHGGHDKAGVRHGDHRLPGKPRGEALKSSAPPLNEFLPAFGSWGKGAGWGGEEVECSIGGTIRLPRKAVGLARVQLTEVAVLLDESNRERLGKHFGCLAGTQHLTTQ